MSFSKSPRNLLQKRDIPAIWIVTYLCMEHLCLNYSDAFYKCKLHRYSVISFFRINNDRGYSILNESVPSINKNKKFTSLCDAKLLKISVVTKSCKEKLYILLSFSSSPLPTQPKFLRCYIYIAPPRKF